ncbi:DUF2776 family protein [Pseudorhizobium sp. NPDC055634]
MNCFGICSKVWLLASVWRRGFPLAKGPRSFRF